MADGLPPDQLPGGPQGPNQGDPVGTGAGDPGVGGTGPANSGRRGHLFGPGGLYDPSPGAYGVGSPDAPGNRPRIGNPAARHALHNLPPWAANRLVRLARHGDLSMTSTGYTPTAGKAGALRIFGGKDYQPGQQIKWGGTPEQAGAEEAALGGIEQTGVERRAKATQAANLRRLVQQQGMA